MEVPGALLTLLLFTSCTAVPLQQGPATTKSDHEEFTSLEASSPAPHPLAVTQAPQSANSVVPQDTLQAANATLTALQYPGASPKFFDEGVVTEATTTGKMGSVSKDVTTVQSGEDLVTILMEPPGTPSPVSQRAAAQGFLEPSGDILDYELSSLKNKPADRLVTVPDISGDRSSMAPTTDDSILKEAVQLAKPIHAPSVSNLSGVHVYEASTSTPNAFFIGEDVPMSSSVPTVRSETNNKGVHLSNDSFVEAPDIRELISKVPPNEKPSATINAIQNYSEVQSPMQSTKVTDALSLGDGAPTIAAVEPTVVPKMETVTRSTVPASSDDFQQAFAFSTLVSSEEPGANGEEDVEQQLESLVITQNSTARPSTQSSTNKPLTANFTNVSLPLEDDNVLIQTAIAQSNSLNESSQLAPAINMSAVIEHASKATEAPSTWSDLVNMSFFGTEKPDVRSEQRPPLNSSNKITRVIALEHATVPFVQTNTSQASIEDESSVITLPLTYSPPLRNTKPNAIAGTAAEPIWEASTAPQELSPAVYNISVQTLPEVDSATLTQPASTISALVSSNISLGATPYLASIAEQEKSEIAVRTSTEAFNATFSSEILHTEVPKDGLSRSAQPTSTYLDPMIISQSSNGDIAFSSTYKLDDTTQEFNTESTRAIASPQSVGNETITDTVLPTASSAKLSTGFADIDNDTALEVTTTCPNNVTEPNMTTDAAHEESMPTADTSTELANTTVRSVATQEVTPDGSDSLHGNESTHPVPKQSTSTERVLWTETETTHREVGTTQAPSGITQASVPSDLPVRASDASTTLTAVLTSALLDDFEDSEEVSSYAPVRANGTTPRAPTPEQETLPAVVRGAPEVSSAPAVVSDVPIIGAPEQTPTLQADITSPNDGLSPAPPTRATTTWPTTPAAPEPAGPEGSPTTTGTTGGGDVASSPPPPVATTSPDCVPLEPPRSPTHEFRLVFNTSAEFSWEQVEALEQRIQRFARDDVCPRRFARTAFALGPPHVLSWTDPSANASWCDRAAVDALLRSMRADTGRPTPAVTRAFYPEFKIVAVELRYRGACGADRQAAGVPVAATAVGVVLSAALVAGLVTLLWRALRRLVPSRKLDATAPSPAAQPSFDLKERRPILLPGENRAVAGTNGTPSKSPHTKPNPPFVVDTDFCYINPNFLEVVKPSPPPPPPYRRSLDRRVRSLEAVLPAPPPRPPHGPHSTLGSRSLRNATPAAEQDEGTSSSSGVESDAQPSGEAKSNESS